MREGPPASTSYSTSTLLKEIASLRGRLKELEDDTKSSVSDNNFMEKESEIMNVLKKELSKVEHEKANLEKEFMNQMNALAAEKRKTAAEFQDKLAQAETQINDLQEQLSKKPNVDEEKWMKIVEEERERHAQEMEQMKQALASSDVEIGESRREMDHLHEQLDEMQLDKEELLRELTDLRLVYSEEQRRTESLREELKQSTTTIQKLRKEIDQENRYKTSTRNVTPGPREQPISPSEKRQLEMEMAQLEDRMQRVQITLAERNATIETLSASLREEKLRAKTLRAELKKYTSEGVEGSPTRRPPSAPNRLVTTPNGTRKSFFDIDSPRTPVARIVESIEGRIAGKIPDSCILQIEPAAIEAQLHSTHPLASELRKELEAEKSLVALLRGQLKQEQLHAQALHEALEQADTSELEQQLEDAQHEIGRLRRQIQDSERAHADAMERLKYVQELEDKLRKESSAANLLRATMEETEQVHVEAVIELETQLKREQALVQELRSDLAAAMKNSLNVSPTLLEKKLSEAQQELSSLHASIDAYKQTQGELEERIQKDQSELTKLRMKTHQAIAEKKNLEIKASVSHEELERLKTKLSYTMDMSTIQDEKKDTDEEEVIRLRKQVMRLQAELDAALGEIERLLAEAEGLRNALRAEQRANLDEAEGNISKKSKKYFDSQINQLKVELTKVQVAKNDLEAEYAKKLREMEDEIETIEASADEELDEKDRELNQMRNALAEKEAKIARLEAQHSQFCSSINDLSTSRHDEIEEIQAELFAMTSKTSAQAREIQSLKNKIEDLDAKKFEMEKKYKARIRSLEDEISVLKHSTRNQSSKQVEDDLRSENIKLREAIRDVKLERRTLQDRLDSLMADKTTSKSAQILRDRNAALKDEVEKLTKRLQKMEASITRVAI